MEAQSFLRFAQTQLAIAMDYWRRCLHDAQTLYQEGAAYADPEHAAAGQATEYFARVREFMIQHSDACRAASESLAARAIDLANEIMADYRSRMDRGEVPPGGREEVKQTAQELLDSARELLGVLSGSKSGETGA